jgi:hypothetical protein
MKKYLFLIFASLLISSYTYVAQPSDFGLKEGDLVSASDAGGGYGIFRQLVLA